MARILIIGGGVSGLSAGIYGQISGHETVIFEQNHIAGGNLTGWSRGGYHIDNCIHWLTGTNPNTDTYKMWETLGALGGVEIVQAQSLFTYDRDGRRLSLWRDLDRCEREMLELSERDGKEIKSFFSAVRILQGMSGIALDTHEGKNTAAQKIKSLPLLYKYYSLSTGELARRFYHPLIREFITSFLGDDFGALALLFIYAHFCGENGGIPRGGSLGMATRMSERHKQLGGNLLTGKKVKKICTDGKRASSVILSDGSEYAADYVIVTTDPAVVFKELLDIPMPRKFARLYSDDSLMRFSAFHCAFSCDMPTVPFKSDIIFEIPCKFQMRLGAKNLVVREFSHEPSFSPEGKNILQSVIFCNEINSLEFIELKKNKAEYENVKLEIADIIEKIIVGKFPQMQGKLECIDVWTPATYKRYIDSEIGSFMSFALPKKRLPLRLNNRIDGVENVSLSTQWLQIPGGLSIAAGGGRIAIETVNAMERKHARHQPQTYKKIFSEA